MAAITSGVYDGKAAGGGFQSGGGFLYDQRGPYTGELMKMYSGASTNDQTVADGVTAQVTFQKYVGISNTVNPGTVHTLSLPGGRSSICIVHANLRILSTNAGPISMKLIFANPAKTVILFESYIANANFVLHQT